MNNIRFKFSALIVLALSTIMIGLTAKAQNPIYYPNLAVITNTCAAQAATNLALVVPCGKQASVTFQLLTQMDAAGTADMKYAFVRSVDGVTYDTAGGTVIGIPATGTTLCCCSTNVGANGCGFIKLLWASNAAATAVCTNLTITWANKISAP